jgi:hypothetical protein
VSGEVPDEVEKKASEWRQTRSQASLNWLYWNYINKLPAETAPIASLLALLGTPDRQTGRSYVYSSKIGPTGQAVLYLEADTLGRLASFGIN